MVWWNNDWDYRLKVKVNSDFVDTTLSGVPLWVRLRAENFDFSRTTTASGLELRFVDSNNTLIAHEVATWNTASGIGDIWVKFPELSSTEDSYVWMYYGNSTPSGITVSGTEVWSDYELVYHLNESVLDGTSGQVLDSSPAGNHGTSTGHPTPDQVGIVGSSIYCDGNDYITSISNSTLTGSSSRTTLLWFKPTVADQGFWSGMLSYGVGTTNQAWFMVAAYQNDDYYDFGLWGATHDTHTWISVDPTQDWNHWALKWDGTNWKGFYNGSTIVDRSATPNTGASSYYVGRNFYDGTNCIGYLDEIRVATKALSDDEIEIQYLNMAEHSKIMSYLSAVVSGTVADKYGNSISGIPIKVISYDKNTLEIMDYTTISGSSYVVGATSSGTEVLISLSYEGTYGEDTNIAGAEFRTPTIWSK